MLICAGLGDAPCRIVCRELSQDIEATANCLRALGAEIEYKDGVFCVTPVKTPVEGAELDCGESGSTLRFLLPILCAMGAHVRVRMHGRLPQRPLSPLWEELERHGAVLTRPEVDIIAIGGRIGGGEYAIDAGISSQFISGLLMALPLTDEGGTLRLTGRVESAKYIDMTCRAMENFGVKCPLDGDTFTLTGGRPYRSPRLLTVEGDWSNAAFWVVANALSGGGLRCTGLDMDSPQGDRAVIECAQRIQKGNAVIDASDIPDLVPVLSVLSAVSPGRTEFINAGRLRIKESDRIATVCAMLNNLGGQVTETAEGLIIDGTDSLKGGVVDSAGDHRIAMSAAVASIACRETVTVLGAQAVSKSYPAFWQDFQRLGGRIVTEE
jgi:3-phosphoshikimate 1-carboxyvinyltransferase